MARTIPNCNRSFLIESLLENKRLDNRTFYQSRNLQVNFGRTFGSCFVQLGNTVMYASTEATLDEPRITRPSEGRFKVIINIGAGGKERWLRNIERSQPTEAILTTRLLEKIINRINVLDLESLCLVTGRTVWCICTKLVLLNFDGNLIEAASIATIASLMHFKRPDATVTPDGDIIVHSYEERNPLPITLFHYPICVTFQFMDRTHLKKILTENQEILPAEKHEQFVRKAQQLLICDPTEEEEDFLRNVLIVCANVLKEIVAIQSIGQLSLQSFSKRLLRLCTEKAFERVRFVTDYLKSTLDSHNNYSGGHSQQQSLFERYGFFEAMLNGDLCIARNFNLNPVYENNDNNDNNDGNNDDNQQQNRQSGLTMFEEYGIYPVNDYGHGGRSKWENQTNNHQLNDDRQSFKSQSQQSTSKSNQFEIRTTQLTDPLLNDQSEQEKSKQNDAKISSSNINKWTIVDKKHAATDSNIRSTIEKFNEKTKKEKQAILAAANVSTNKNEDDNDEEDNTIQLQWEFQTKNSKNNKKRK